jgi:hypothetical protein
MKRQLLEDIDQENTHLRKEIDLLMKYTVRLKSIQNRWSSPMILTDLRQDQGELLNIIERNRHLISRYETNYEDILSQYEITLERSLESERSIVNRRNYDRSYLMQEIFKEEERIQKLEKLLAERMTNTAKQLTDLKVNQNGNRS